MRQEYSDLPADMQPETGVNSNMPFGWNVGLNVGRLFWYGLLAVAILFAVSTAAGIQDAQLLTSWSSQGAKRTNDRHVPISSIWTGNFDLSTPPTWTYSLNAPVSSTPAIWDGIVFSTNWLGSIFAHHEHTGELLWGSNICEDIYGKTTLECTTFLEDLIPTSRQYISVASISISGDDIFISLKQPPDIIRLNQKTGVLVAKRSLTDNIYAEITQSGTVWNNVLYVGTSISDANITDDVNCTFIGEFFALNLGEALMPTIWSVSMDDIAGTHSTASGFTGMRIKGSSPAYSSEYHLITFTVGPAVCTPTWYSDCLTPCNGSNLDYEGYEDEYARCDTNTTAADARYNSVVVLNARDGTLFWAEKLRGYRAWSASCLGHNASNPCIGLVPLAECNFYTNPYFNCMLEYDSCIANYDWADDPVLQLQSDGGQTMYVQQNNGNIYSFNLRRELDAEDIVPPVRNQDDGRMLWSTMVAASFYGGGLSVGKSNVYFSIYSDVDNPLDYSWSINSEDDTTLCGGWGSLVSDDGLPVWYTPNPMCNVPYDVAGTAFLNPLESGGRSPPTLTNDFVLVTSEDKYPSSAPLNTLIHLGGFVYTLNTKTGLVDTSYETRKPVLEGFSVHGRCAYVGNGFPTDINNITLFAFCVPQAFVPEVGNL